MKRKFDYGIILVERLKQIYPSFLDLRTIAEENKLPLSFLEKVAQELKRAGWIESKRGIGGGYRLVKKPGDVGVGELINFFERTGRLCPVSRIAKMKI